MSVSAFQEVAKPVATAVILGGGHGTRLWPASLATPKNLLPAQSTPLVLAAVNEAAEAGIQDVVIVSGPDEQALYQNLFSPKPELENDMAGSKKFDALKILRDLSEKGARIKYAIQEEPRGAGRRRAGGAPAYRRSAIRCNHAGRLFLHRKKSWLSRPDDVGL